MLRALENELDLEEEAEKFMQRQAKIESGDTSVPTIDAVVGTETVPDEAKHPSIHTSSTSF